MSDPTNVLAVPPEVRDGAFRAAMLAVQHVLAEHGYRLDPLAELELVDRALGDVAADLGADDDDELEASDPGPVH